MVGPVDAPGINALKVDKLLKTEDNTNVSFSKILTEFFNETVSAQKDAEKAVRDFVLGKSEDMHDVVIAMQKADIAFRLLLEVRNRALESYQEIMRLQV